MEQAIENDRPEGAIMSAEMTWEERIDQIARGVANVRNEDWRIGGSLGSGKTSLMSEVADRLAERNFIPTPVLPPRRTEDPAPAALVQVAEALKAHRLINGQIEVVTDLRVPWETKVASIVDAIQAKGHSNRVILFCDG